MKKLVFYYLFVGLPALLMLVSTSRTIIEYGSFPFTGSLLSQKFYFNRQEFSGISLRSGQFLWGVPFQSFYEEKKLYFYQQKALGEGNHVNYSGCNQFGCAGCRGVFDLSEQRGGGSRFWVHGNSCTCVFTGGDCAGDSYGSG